MYMCSLGGFSGICSSWFCGTKHFRQSSLYLRFIFLVWGTEIYELIVQSFSFTATIWKAPAALKDPQTSSQNFLAAAICLWLPLFVKIINSQASWLRGRLFHLFFADNFTMFCWWSFILIATNLICFYFNCSSCTLAEMCKSWQVFVFVSESEEEVEEEQEERQPSPEPVQENASGTYYENHPVT